MTEMYPKNYIDSRTNELLRRENVYLMNTPNSDVLKFINFLFILFECDLFSNKLSVLLLNIQ